MQFGTYDPQSDSALDAEADLYVTCDLGVGYSIRLDAGANSGGSFHPRRLAIAGGAGFLAYNLYRDAGRREIWGDGSNSTFVHSGVGTGTERRYVTYGLLPGNQNVPAGLYSDVLSVLVEW